MNEEKTRRGKFILDGELIRIGSFEVLKKIMDKVVVFHTEARFDQDTITYFAYHPAFDELDYSEQYPIYEPIVTILPPKEIIIEWRKVL